MHEGSSEIFMGTSRMEAFSDGVIAIIITIMVLELKLPRAVSLATLIDEVPVLLSYVLSFLVVAIMWVNHHHVLHQVKQVNGRLLWLNIHLLFWMSLIPFSTGLIGEDHDVPLAAFVYGVNLAMASLAFTFLVNGVARAQSSSTKRGSHRRRIQQRNITTVVVYAAAASLAFVSVYLAYAVYVILPILYFVPEKQLPSV